MVLTNNACNKICRYIYSHIISIYLLESLYHSNEIKRLTRLKGFNIFLMMAYCFLIFFEKPFWCYQKTTFTYDDLKV